MPSLIPGYEYDVFISYRHNDNRSGWVTEFVKHLNEELAATIKEPVSVYIDSNPTDGILETHNRRQKPRRKTKMPDFYSDSLKPIVIQSHLHGSKNSVSSINQSAGDPLGRDIKLINGNVASRILPVKIHDLDGDDKAMIENEIGWRASRHRVYL